MKADGGVDAYGPFDEGPLTIEQRFREKGRARQDKVWSVYVVHEGHHSPLYDKQGTLVHQGVIARVAK